MRWGQACHGMARHGRHGSVGQGTSGPYSAWCGRRGAVRSRRERPGEVRSGKAWQVWQGSARSFAVGFVVARQVRLGAVCSGIMWFVGVRHGEVRLGRRGAVSLGLVGLV